MGPGYELVMLDDRALLAGGVADGVAEAQAAAKRWARLAEFYRRRESDHRAREAVSPHFTLTPRQETAVEVAELWGRPESRVRHELNVALFLEQHLPRVWELCLPASWTPTGRRSSPTRCGMRSATPSTWRASRPGSRRSSTGTSPRRTGSTAYLRSWGAPPSSCATS